MSSIEMEIQIPSTKEISEILRELSLDIFRAVCAELDQIDLYRKYIRKYNDGASRAGMLLNVINRVGTISQLVKALIKRGYLLDSIT